MIEINKIYNEDCLDRYSSEFKPSVANKLNLFATEIRPGTQPRHHKDIK